ncbi:MAG: hypothetical protein M3290_11080 [Actinomycetota bacterium]|nr:hypothetical protein [Actinomycetota bacterium]
MGSIRGWLFDLHAMGYVIDLDRVTAAERAAVAAVSLGADLEDALELARVVLDEGPLPEVAVTL